MNPVLPLLALSLPLLMNTAAPAVDIRTGDPFPAIVLPSIEDGAALSTEQFRGQKLMLHIFASW